MRGRRALPRSASRVVVIAMALLMVASGPTLAASRPLDDERPPTFELLGGDAVAELAAELDYDLERIYRFVADEVRYEPYAGILRGARGTLAGRAGNSWDQALLLAALLDESLIEYRFARGPLEQTAADQLLAALSISATELRTAADQLLVGDLDAAVPAGVEAADSGARARAQAASEAVDATIARAGRQLANDVATIGSALTDAGVELPPTVPTLPSSELVDHAWVQASLGAEWLDLDPVLAGREVGTALAEPQETVASPPPELDHVVEFEVSLERVQGSSLVTEPIVQYSATAASLAGRALTFGHVKPGGLERLGITMRNLLGEGADEYRAALDIDGQSIVSDVAIVFGRSDADGGGLFGDTDLFGEPAASPGSGPVDGEATAEWLEVRVTPPSGDPVSARRTVFDRVAPAARFAGTPGTADVGPPVMVDLGEGDGPEVAAMVGMEGFVVATGPTSGAALVARATDPAGGVLGTAALAYQYLRDVLAAEIGAEQGLRIYLDGPTVASVSMSVEPTAAEPTLRLGLDLWHRNIGTLPLADAATAGTHPAVIAGVLAHVAERVALDQPGSDSDEAPADHLSTGALFEAAAAAGIPTVAYQGRLPDDSAYDPETVARMGEALAGGEVIVAPREPVEMAGNERMAWWRVDPVSGRTIDVLDDGAGAEQAEYTIPLTWEFRAASCLLALSGGILAGVVEALDLGGFDSAKHGVSIAAIIFQSFAAARGWTGSCR